ncbi:hypothetical protein X975_09373, partial [Stegodyphus mimosarum]
MNEKILLVFAVIALLATGAFSKDISSLETDESSAPKSLSLSSELSPHVEPSGAKKDNKTNDSLSSTSRRIVNHARAWKALHQTSTEASVMTTSTTARSMSDNEIIHKRWNSFEKSVKKIIEGRMKKALPMFLRMGSDAKLSAGCSKSIMALVQGVRGMKNWAFRMLDASAKLPSGVLDGTLSDFGEYDQCLEVVKEDNRKKIQFTGQYCTVEAVPLLPPVPHRVQFKTVVLDFANFSHPDSVSNQNQANFNF